MHLDSLGMNRGDKPSQESQRLMEMVGGGLKIPSTVATEHALVQVCTEGRMRTTPRKEHK